MSAHPRDLSLAESLKAFQEAYGRVPRWVLREVWTQYTGELRPYRSRWATREDQIGNTDDVRGFVDTIDEALAWVREPETLRT